MSSLRISIQTQEELEHDSDWTERLIDSVKVVSFIPGRIRFHLGFEGDEMLADSLRREIQKLDSVHLDSYSIRTKNALVSYDPKHVEEHQVASALFRGVLEFARVHGECDLEHHHHEREHTHEHHEHDNEHDEDDEEDCAHDHSALATDAGIRKELFKLVATGGLLGYFVYRKIKGKPIAFEGNPLLEVTSLLTIASGYRIFRDGIDVVQKGKKPTDDTLISIAVVATLLMGESLTGLSVVWLINLGRLLEAVTLKRSRTAIKELMDVAPKDAWLVIGIGKTGKSGSKKDTAQKVLVEELKKGQVIRIFESEKVPLDGKIIHGHAAVKEALITGESLPQEKTIGDTVYAGSIIEQGEIDIEVTNLVHETVIARMIDAIENVRDNKAPIEKIGTRFASQFVPISLGLAGVTLIMTGDLRRAITMLVIACPCAAGLATPTAVSASIGQAARRGILIKGGTHLEAAAHIDTIVFDKTGTLTEGKATVHQFIATEEGKAFGLEDCQRVAASAEQYTTHPLGVAIFRDFQNDQHKKTTLLTATTHKIHPGLGIYAEVDGKKVHIGNRKFMTSVDVMIPISVERQATDHFIAGESLVYLSIDGIFMGTFVIHDTIRVEAHEMLERLKSLGIKRVLIATGDQKIAASYVAKSLGISEIHAELLPDDKLKLLTKLKEAGCRVAMVGDGVNDAQALAEADLSIAMGAGRCDIAIEAADVTLAKNNLLLVADTLEISQQTLRTIHQNFFAAVGINTGGIIIGSLGKLSPFSAAIVHNASTIAVVVNSLRLGRQVAKSNPFNVLKEVKI
jgi:cation-transporting P-type ATPase C